MDTTTINLTTLIVVALASTGLLLATFGLLQYRINSRRAAYDTDKSRANLEEVRASLERQIYALNDRLMSAQSRWLDVNHLVVASQPRSLEGPRFTEQVELNNFLTENGVRQADTVIDPKSVFVLTPFHSDFESDFETISTVGRRVGLRVTRGDETNSPGEIFTQILRQIVRAQVIVANLNGRNPNVMYELGIAQALDKPVILVSRSPESLPFDVRSKRIVVYTDASSLSKELTEALLRLSVGHTPTNSDGA